MTSSDPQVTLQTRHYSHPYFTEEEAEAPGVTCPRVPATNEQVRVLTQLLHTPKYMPYDFKVAVLSGNSCALRLLEREFKPCPYLSLPLTNNTLYVNFFKAKK